MGTTYYLYDTGGQLLGEYDASGQPIKEYVHLEGEPIAQVDNTSITYLHTDHLATPRKATNEAGQVVWQWESEAFGNALPQSSGIAVNLRFPGQYYDAETGLYYNYFRYYDPGTGRYVTSDPIGLQGGLNTYGYVGGNPVNAIDPRGLITWQESHDLYEAAKADNPLPDHEPNGTHGFGWQAGTTTHGPDGWGQSMSTGAGAYWTVCEKKRDECEENDPAPRLPDSISGSYYIFGTTVRSDGTVCFHFGLILTWPLVAPNWDLPN